MYNILTLNSQRHGCGLAHNAATRTVLSLRPRPKNFIIGGNQATLISAPMPRAAAASVSPLTCRDTRCACQRRRRVNRDARWACAVALDIWARPPVHMRQRAHIHAPSNGEQTPRPREGRHAERATRPRMGAATRRDASRRAARAPPLCPGQAAARCPYAGRITATLPTFGRYSFNIKRKC